MSSLLAEVPQLKSCGACAGIGREGSGLAQRRCSVCGGSGKVRRREPIFQYVATQGSDVIDIGGPLESFVADLCQDFSLEDEDVTIWRIADNAGPRVVAILSPDGQGKTVARWL